jgi:phage terminase large subunit
VRSFGADNSDRIRGLYLDEVVFDEYCLPPRNFTEVVRPALSDRQGVAWFLGTPAGKTQSYDVIQQPGGSPRVSAGLTDGARRWRQRKA